MRFFILLSLLLLHLVGCTCDSVCKHYRTQEKEWFADNGRLKVLSTTAMINDIVERIGQDQVDTLVLIRGELDPHTYQMVKGDDEKFSFADIIFYNGLGLEHGPSVQKHLAENRNAVALGDSVLKDHSQSILHYNGQIDPHIWMDVSIWAETVPYIVEKLSTEDPDHADFYRANGKQLQEELRLLHKQVAEEISSIPEQDRYLVTSHDAFNYFARAYLATDSERSQKTWQKRFTAPEGLAPESQLSSVDIQEIIDHMKEYRIEVIFPESNVSRDSIRKIVEAGREKGLNLKIADAYLYGDAMGPPGSDGDSYNEMIQYNARTLKSNLKAK